MTRRVVVTGVGLVCALGVGTEESWKNLVAGKSGVGPITQFDPKRLKCRIAAEVKGFDPLQFLEKKDVKKMDTFIQFALAAATFAMNDAQLISTDRLDRARLDERDQARLRRTHLAQTFGDGGASFVFVPIVTRDTSTRLQQRLPVLIENGALEQAAGITLDPARSQVMLCGNPQMVDDTRNALKARGLTMNRRGEGNIAVENYW